MRETPDGKSALEEGPFEFQLEPPKEDTARSVTSSTAKPILKARKAVGSPSGKNLPFDLSVSGVDLRMSKTASNANGGIRRKVMF